MWEGADAAQKKSRRERLDAISYTFDATFGPVENRLRRAAMSADEKGRVWEALERYIYRATGHEAYMGRVHKEIVEPLLQAELEWIDLAEFLFHNRVVHERYESQHDRVYPKSSQESLDELQTEGSA